METAGEVGGSQFSHNLGSEGVYDQVCQPCLLDGKLHDAAGLCTDCQEYLCQRCFDGHTLPTPTRNHEMLDKSQMVQRQVSLKKEDKCSEKCAVHEDEVIKYYCIDHCQLGCSCCITLDHRSCDNVRYIPQLARDLANNEEYKQAENQFDSVLKRAKKVTEEYKQKTKSAEKACSEAVQMVEEFREEINEALDKIRGDLVSKCETMKTEELEKVAQIVEKYKAVQRDLEILQTMKETYQNNKQNCNLYIAMMKAKEKLTIAEEIMTEAENEQYSKNSQIKFVPNKDTLVTLKNTESFGKLSNSGATNVISEQRRTNIIQTEKAAGVKKRETKSSLGQMEGLTVVKRDEPKMTVRQTEAQTGMKRSESTTIVRAHHVQDINVKSSTDPKTCNITGLVVLSDNRLLVTDYNRPIYDVDNGNGNVKLVDIKKGHVICMEMYDIYGHVKLVEQNSWLKWTILTPSLPPYGVAMITNNQVAVTLPGAKKVAMVNVSATAMNVDRSLNVNGECYGVAYRDDKLAVTFCNPDEVQVLTLEGRVLYTISKDKQGQNLFRNPQYIVFGHDSTSLYVSAWGRYNVVHAKLDGTVVGRYRSKELIEPSGLLTDSSGNVYVCGEDTDNIHQITPDCRKIQVLLTRADGLHWPRCISYNEAECRLYVGMLDNKVVKEYRVTPNSK